jgi:glycosyltransferase involved in cell wall biosynthesis
MHCPTLAELPPPLTDKTGWPWTEESQQISDTTQDKTPWPKVSIVTPSYNQGRFLEESIRSVLLQGYPDLEYIIIDGGSTDESVEIIKKYEQWLTYWVSEPDRGQSHAINKGLDRSTGQLFNWQNADDVLTPNSLVTTATAMVKYPNVSYAHGYRILIDRNSSVLGNTMDTLGDKPRFAPDLVSSIVTLTGGMQPGCLMRRDLVLEEGKIAENLHYVMDRDILLRLALRYPPFYVARPVVFLREYPDAKSFLWNANRAQERLIIARKIFRSQNLSPSITALKRSVFATAHRFAWECYAKAGMRVHAVWHVFMDILYLPGEGWNQRQRLMKTLVKQYPKLWLRVWYIVVRKIATVISMLKAKQN